jgi:hypothetical protein
MNRISIKIYVKMDNDEVFYDILPPHVEDIDTESNEDEEQIEEELVTDESEEETSNESSDEETDTLYDIESQEYKKYLKKILGKETHIVKDEDFRTFTLTENTKTFIGNIQEYSYNLEIIEDHWKEIAESLKGEEKPKINSEFTVVEFTKLKTKDKKSLCVLFDGHHRYKALQEIYKVNPKIIIKIRICVIQSDLPGSIETNILFKKYNKMKPFIVEFDKSEITIKIINILNIKFSCISFKFIKTQSHANRPSITTVKLNTAIINRLSELSRRFQINYNDIDIDSYIKNFEIYNKKLAKKDKDYFKSIDKSITDKMVETAKKANCFLGLVNIDMIVRECIGKEYN